MKGSSLLIKSRSQLPFLQSKNTDRLACAMDGWDSVKNSKKKEVRRHSRRGSEDKTSTNETFNLVMLQQKGQENIRVRWRSKGCKGVSSKTFKIANLWLTHIFYFRFTPKDVLEARMAIPRTFSATHTREESFASRHVNANVRILRFCVGTGYPENTPIEFASPSGLKRATHPAGKRRIAV